MAGRELRTRLRQGTWNTYLRALTSDLTTLGCQVDYRILDATAYGIPQRRRLFVVGMAPGRAFTWPPATYGPGTSRAVRTAGEVISADITVGDPNPSEVTYAKNPVIRPSPFAGLLFNGGGRPLNLAAPVPTVLASVGWNRTPGSTPPGSCPNTTHTCAGAARHGQESCQAPGGLP